MFRCSSATASHDTRTLDTETPNHIAEGFDCDSQAEFARFLGYSRRSAVEVQSLLYAAIDIGYINQTIFDAQYQQAEKAKALIGGLKTSLKKRNP